MADIIPFPNRQSPMENTPIIEKVVDGEFIECVNVDALSAREREEFFGRVRPASPQGDQP